MAININSQERGEEAHRTEATCFTDSDIRTEAGSHIKNYTETEAYPKNQTHTVATKPFNKTDI